jgi:3-hexulose-6-phosphate synthase
VKAGINVALGTGSAVECGNMDMFEVMRFGAMQERIAGGDATALPAAAALMMATVCGARAQGRADQCGMLQVGMDAVTQVKSAFPDLEVLADTKIWHNGARIADCAFEHGADMVTILAGATDREVETVVAVAEQRGAKVAADMAGVEGLVQRSAELEDLGVRYMVVPSGLRVYEDELHDHDAFHRNTRAVGGMPLALVRNIERALSGSAEVAVVDNITLNNLDAVLATRQGILLVGRAILSADDPAAAAAEFRRRMDEAVS